MEQKIKVVNEVKSYGHLDMSSKDFPEVKDLKIGTSIKVTVTLNVRSLRSPDMWEIAHNKDVKPTDVRASGQISKIEFPKKEDKK